MNNYMVPLIAAVVIMGGCGKKEDPVPVAPQPPLMQPGAPLPATEPTSPLPAPNVPKGPVPELPKPGQANDHSSPAFKSGGKADKPK